MFNLNLQEREKNILAGLSVALIVFVFFFVTKPSIDKHSTLKNTIISLEKEIKSPKATREDIEQFKKEIETLTKDIETLKYQIPNTEKRGFLIRDLENLARKNGIEVLSFVPQEAIAVSLSGQEISNKVKRYLKRKKRSQVKGKVMKTIINIESNGSFTQYKKFFKDIITYYRAVEVSNIEIAKGSGGKKRGVDKRFARKTKGLDALTEYEDPTLSVSFDLYAYTNMDDSKVVTSNSKS